MKIVLLILIIAGFLLLHAIKLMRLYLITIDQKIPFARFMLAYLRTTLVNLIIPFKLGEIYRIVVFSRITKNGKVGFLSVLVDRFFDTFAIVLILLPYQLMISRNVTLPGILLSGFLIVVVFAYIIYPSTYRFLNRYIITSKTSSRSMATLKGLEVVNEWYEYVRILVTGRYGILILFSLAAWTLEILVIAGFAKIIGRTFTVADFGAYIESILSGTFFELSRAYNQVGIVVMCIATIVGIIIYMASKKRN